jgi:N6-L-threonylcarbamoyladenine synthase
MLVLGIETSCDETALAVVNGERQIIAQMLLSQWEEHRPYGGVVPEIAARAHLDYLPPLWLRLMAELPDGFRAISAIAATGGPGLIGGVLVGTMFAKGLAAARRLPYLAINHLEGHALSARLSHALPFPYLLLLVSGGHTQLLLVHGVGAYRCLGTTIDDAVGEAFDKSAKLLGLDQPGGPNIEKAARLGNPHRFALPRPLAGRGGCDFSFSGLKNAVRLCINAQGPSLSSQDCADICASLELAIADILEERSHAALQMLRAQGIFPPHFVIAGGVAANLSIRTRLQALADTQEIGFVAPPLNLCTDNAAMIAWAGVERLSQGFCDNLDFAPRPRWPLESLEPGYSF